MMIGHASAVNRARVIKKLEREFEALHKAATDDQKEDMDREVDRMKSQGLSRAIILKRVLQKFSAYAKPKHPLQEEEDANSSSDDEDSLEKVVKTIELDQDDEAPPARRYNLDQSILNIRDWGDIKAGYMKLLSFTAFVIVFFTMLCLQTDVENGFNVDLALRQGLISQADSVDSLMTSTQLWSYLYSAQAGVTTGGKKKKKKKKRTRAKKGGGGGGAAVDKGMLQLLFDERWYGPTTPPMPAENLGFVLLFNKLVGGVMLTQTRNPRQPCPLSSIYRDFYSACQGSDGDDTLPFADFTGHADWCSDISSAPSPYSELKITAFCHNETLGTYSQFLPVSNGYDLNGQVLAALRAASWTDHYTNSMSVKFATYNGNANVFTYVDVKFEFGIGGVIIQPIQVVIQSVKVEQYSKPADMIRLVLELAFLVFVGAYWSDFIAGLVVAVWEIDRPSTQRSQGDKLNRAAAYLFNVWSIVDVINLSMLLYSISLRVQFLYSLMSNPLTLPINYYPQVLEDAASLQILQIQINVINILFVIFRFFKLYKFQDQLRELSDTFAAAWTDLYHFMIMWLLVFAGFSLIGHIMFGQHMMDYSSILRSFVTQFEMMMNNYDYVAMSRIAPFFAPIYLIMFVFIASICLINILVAILMDAYDVATERPFSRSIVEQLAIIANRTGMHLSRELEPLKNKVTCQSVVPEENVSDNDDNLPPPKPISTSDMLTILSAKKEAMRAEGDASKEEAESFAVELEELTTFATTVLPGGGPSGFDLMKKMSILREAEEVTLGPRIDEKLFKVEVDLVRRENERLNRQIEILANKVKPKVSNDVLVREGWLDKRSERIYQSNPLKKTAMSLRMWLPRWFQLFSDRLAYYESNLDAFPSSRKERKTVALKRVTGIRLLGDASDSPVCVEISVAPDEHGVPFSSSGLLCIRATDSVLAASWKDDIHKSVFAVLKSKSVQGSSDRQ